MDEKERWKRIPPGERILLLPHCLRPSSGCPGQMTRQGLVCPPDCPLSCPIGVLRKEAERLGYKGAFVAPGGVLALGLVREIAPRGILAIACTKELLEGRQAVAMLGENPPVVVALALSRDGCVDTAVDLEQARKLLELGLESCTWPLKAQEPAQLES